MPRSYTGNVGTRITAYLGIDVSNATGTSGIYYEITKPDGTSVNWPVTVQDEESGIVYYQTLDGDLDQTGRYKIQPYVYFDEFQHWHATSQFYDVHGDD